MYTGADPVPVGMPLPIVAVAVVDSLTLRLAGAAAIVIDTTWIITVCVMLVFEPDCTLAVSLSSPVDVALTVTLLPLGVRLAVIPLKRSHVTTAPLTFGTAFIVKLSAAVLPITSRIELVVFVAVLAISVVLRQFSDKPEAYTTPTDTGIL